MSEFCKFLSNGLVYNNDNVDITVSPCCYFKHKNTLDINKNPANQILQHRLSWIKEDVVKTCKICLDMEASGLHSYRQSSFDMVTDSDKIEILTVAVNKQCNLACPSCSAHSSSFWYQENLRNNIFQDLKIHQWHLQNQNHNNQVFVDTLSKQDLSQLTYIKFGGGEPLMSDIHLQILKLIPSPEKVTVQYTSNFTIMPTKKVIVEWEKFKLIKWMASLDGVKQQFEFLRWPARWDNLQTMIQKSYNVVPHNVMFGVEHTLNPLNIWYYDCFQSWFETNFFQNRYGDRNDFNIHTCSGELDISHTPPKLRQKIKNKYGIHHELSTILDRNPWSGSTRSMTDYLSQICQMRNQNWRLLFPEVEMYFD
jgi:hypothetical protein